MKKIIERMIEENLAERITNIWKVCSGTTIKIPYTVEEAGFNSILLASIYTYIDKHEANVFSFPISESEIQRTEGKGRSDIIWYREKEACYFELKGSVFGGGYAKTDVNNTKKALKIAKEQLNSTKCQINEAYYYKWENKSNASSIKRYGCNLAMVQSVLGKDGTSKFDELKQLLLEEKNEGNINILYPIKFEGTSFMTDNDKDYKNDGCFLIGNFYEYDSDNKVKQIG